MAMAMGCLGQMGVMEVPSIMRWVRAAAAAKMVRASGPAALVVIQAAGIPKVSARWMRSRASTAVEEETAMPMLLVVGMVASLMESPYEHSPKVQLTQEAGH